MPTLPARPLVFLAACAVLVAAGCPSGRSSRNDRPDDAPECSASDSSACAASERCIDGTCCSLTRACGGSCCGAGSTCVGDPEPRCAAVDCSPAKPGGLCASGRVCVGGQCCTAARMCEGGCCPEGQVCDGGACVASECSPAQPSGSCPGGMTCENGECCPGSLACAGACCGPSQACAGGACCDSGRVCGASCCAAGDACVQGSCCPAARVCGAACCASGQTCRPDGTCGAASDACSPQRPDGTCPPGSACVGGRCEVQGGGDCSPSNPAGACPARTSCVNGSCCPTWAACGSTCCTSGACENGRCRTTSDACGPSNPQGSCPSGAVCTGGACCDSNLACGARCCTPGQSCQNGACVDAACSPQNPWGACPSGRTCVGGTCCVPAAVCGSSCCGAGQSCDTQTGTCRSACSPTNLSGWCPSGQQCINGACVQPVRAGIGGACTANEQCTEGLCLDAATYGFSWRGYCSKLCSQEADCPSGSTCNGARDGQQGICMKSCSTTTDCGTGNYCYQGLCLNSCAGAPSDYCGNAFGSDYTCINGRCRTAGTAGAQLGGPCGTDAECPTGSICIPDDQGLPGGYCMYADFGSCSENPCPGAACVRFSNGFAACVPRCSSNSGCPRPEYACASKGQPDGSRVNICWLPCGTTGDCPLDGTTGCDTRPRTESATGGMCIPWTGARGSAQTGDACNTTGDCEAGLSCLPPGVGMPGGYCTRECSSASPCPTGDVCTSTASGDGLCTKACSTGTCRAGYECRQRTPPYCWAKCTSDSDCAPYSCNLESGYCE